MTRMIKSFMRKYGSKIKITENDNTITKKGFVHHLYRKSKYYYKINLVTAGRFDDSHYLLITEPGAFENQNSEAVVECNGKKYLCKSNGTYIVNDKELYVWAVLAAYTNSVEDDYDSDI